MQLSTDPRGEVWARDTSKFGYRMLMKMGWSEGKGLGVKEDGITRHLSVAKKFDNLGLGVDPSASSKAWQTGTTHYSQLLSNLNKVYGTQEGNADGTDSVAETTTTPSTQPPTEKPPKQIRRHLIYSRRLASKNAANYSSTDMAAILGGVTPATPNDPRLSKVEDEESEETSTGLVTITSTTNITDYFKSRTEEKRTQDDEEQTTDPKVKPEKKSKTREKRKRAEKKKEMKPKKKSQKKDRKV